MNKTVAILIGWMAASLVAATVTLATVPALTQERGSGKEPLVLRTPLRLLNAGFENGLESWGTSTSDAQAYEFAADTEVFRSGKQSARIHAVAGENGGAIHQVIPIAALRGRTIELSGWLKTEDVSDGGAVLTMRVYGDNNRLLEYNLMRNAPVKGTTDWKRYSIPVKVSKNAWTLEVGVALNNKGTVWLDDLELNVISRR